MRRSTVTPFQNKSSHQRCSIKKLLLKIWQSITGKHLCWSLLLIVAELQARNFIKKRLQHGCFPVNIAKSLKAAILKIICKRLLLPLELFCKEFVDISCENASFSIPEESIWLKLIYFFTTIAFWLMKYLFLIDGNILRVLATNLTLCRINRSNQPSWKIHGTA